MYMQPIPVHTHCNVHCMVTCSGYHYHNQQVHLTFDLNSEHRLPTCNVHLLLRCYCTMYQTWRWRWQSTQGKINITNQYIVYNVYRFPDFPRLSDIALLSIVNQSWCTILLSMQLEMSKKILNNGIQSSLLMPHMWI